MNDELKNFINENLDLINENSKESWKEIYEKLDEEPKLKGEFTKTILDAGINDPTAIMGYVPRHYLYNSSIANYKILDNVTSIGLSAFADCGNLTSIVIPDSVAYISDYAFYECDNLTSVKIGNGVISIEDGAFYHCINLTSVVIPDSVTYIDQAAFTLCYKLTNVIIGSGVTNIGEAVFYNCPNLKEIHYKGTRKQAITKLKVKNKSWRKGSAIEKIICTDGEIIL